MQLIATIEAAIANPTHANLRKLLAQFDQEFDPEKANRAQDGQFKTAGDIIVLLAQLIELRANLLLKDWEERHNPCLEEPILTAEMLQEVLRQTMTLNLEEILELPERQERQDSDSVVGAVEKENLMEFIEQLELAEAKQKALSIAYEEDITAWVNVIKEWLKQHRLTVSILELHHHIQMPFVQVWLALLLGGFELEQQGNFYDGASIMVKPRN